MYKIYLKHKNENYFSIIINGRFHQAHRWLRKNQHKYKLLYSDYHSWYFEE